MKKILCFVLFLTISVALNGCSYPNTTGTILPTELEPRFLSFCDSYLPSKSNTINNIDINFSIDEEKETLALNNIDFCFPCTNADCISPYKATSDDNIVKHGDIFKEFETSKENIKIFFNALNIDMSDKLSILKLKSTDELSELVPAAYMGGTYITVSSKSNSNFDVDIENIMCHEIIHYLLSYNTTNWFINEKGSIQNYWLNEAIASIIANFISGCDTFEENNKFVFSYNRQLNTLSVLLKIYGIDFLKDAFLGNVKSYEKLQSDMGTSNFKAFSVLFDHYTMSTMSDEFVLSILNNGINPIFQDFVIRQGYNFDILSLNNFYK